MFRYQPPKSSIWGHSLRRMPAERARALLHEFLRTAVADYKYLNGTLAIEDASGDLIGRYEALAGVASVNRFFSGLDEEQSRRCLDQLVIDESAAESAAEAVLLLHTFGISAWRIHGREKPTNSQLIMYYGRHRCLSTFFRFESVEDFMEIKLVMEEVGLCKLNEKHLKPVKNR